MARLYYEQTNLDAYMHVSSTTLMTLVLCSVKACALLHAVFCHDPDFIQGKT